MENPRWESGLTLTTPDTISIRGYSLDELIGRVGFPSVLYLLYVGELPTPAEARLIDALMVASIDHGPGTPSALAARVAISGGASLSAAGAAGILTMGDLHGAAVESCMSVLQRVVDASAGDAERAAIAADEIVATFRADRLRLPGFGHRQHKSRDPRITRLFDLAADAGKSGHHIEAAQAIESALSQATGTDLPINIDGAMAAILGDIEFPPELSNALFISARLAGVLRHAVEEKSMSPMRRIDPTQHEYSGPDQREVPKGYPG